MYHVTTLHMQSLAAEAWVMQGSKEREVFWCAWEQNTVGVQSMNLLRKTLLMT